MENNAQPASSPPPKPWERAGSSSGPAPFRPPSGGNTSEVVEASGTAQPGEVVTTTSTNVNGNTVGRPVPTRPWEKQQTYKSTFGGQNYNSGYGSGKNVGPYGRVGGGYGGRLYGNNMYRGGYGGLYGGGPLRGYERGMGGASGEQDPPSPPSFWISLMRVMQGIVNFFGRVAILSDQNAQAFHMLMSALIQIFDLSGMLYGELARFVLRILGIQTKPKKVHPGNQNQIEAPKAAPSGGWDSVWSDAK